MIKKKLSLSLINSLLLIIFLVTVTLAILVSSYLNTQKVVNKNIEDYFNQTYNLSKLILSNEQKNLDIISNRIAFTISEKKYKRYDQVINSVEKFESLDEIDLLFIKTKKNVYDYSNSLFDTNLIVKKINELNLTSNRVILRFKIYNEDIILMLNSRKIVDSETGRVNAVLYSGKIFNDNFALINNIKGKAKLSYAYIYYGKKLITSTDAKESVDFSIFKKKSVYKNNEFIYSNMEMEIFNNETLNFVFVTKNKSFSLLQESFINQSLILLIFVSISFLVLYILSNKYIIKPFSKLLQFANDVKDKEHADYEPTNVLEFDRFAGELKNIINELRDVKEQYSRAIDGVQDGLWDINLKTKKVFYSSRFMEMLGYESDEKINYKSFWQKNIHKDDYKRTMHELKKHLAFKTDLFESEYRFKCKNGNYKWFKIRGKIFADDNGTFYRMTGFHTDINDLVILQQENINKEQMLFQQSKLAAMGEMIGNIAHQWRQPLSVISMISSGMKLEIELGLDNKTSASKNLQKMLDATTYLSSIIEKFRNFFNPNNVSEEFYITDAFNDNIEIFESSYKLNNIELVLELEKVKILSYKFELMQVIINILSNSKDALKVKDLENKYIFIKTIVGEKNLIIRIRDNAGGIPKHIKDKIYEPYFTTKHQSQGTGLGLYMSSEIVKRHLQGKISNETKTYFYKGKELTGEEFQIELPLL